MQHILESVSTVNEARELENAILQAEKVGWQGEAPRWAIILAESCGCSPDDPLVLMQGRLRFTNIYRNTALAAQSGVYINDDDFPDNEALESMDETGLRAILKQLTARTYLAKLQNM